jgi:hypothetical protein
MISTEDTLKAYEDTGIEPCSVTIGVVQDGKVIRACGIGAYGIWKGLWTADEAIWDGVWEYRTFGDEVSYDRLAKVHGEEYTTGWYNGFDYAMTGGQWGSKHEDPLQMPIDITGFKHGYDAGKAVRRKYPDAVSPSKQRPDLIIVSPSGAGEEVMV